MTTITITIEDFFGSGGDSNSLFISSAPYQINQANISGTGGSGSLEFYRYSGGVPETASPYTLTAFGEDFGFVSGVNDINGDVTSLTMTRRFGNGPLELMTSASFSLDGSWATRGGVTISSLESMTVDTLVGRVLQGSTAELVLVGAAGGDTLRGSFWHDTLRGNGGGDTLLGGEGIDTASYAGSPAGVTVNLATGATAGGDAAGDILSSIENLIGSDLADTLTGDAKANRIDGGLGGGVLRGGNGEDRVNGGLDADTIYGDADNDVIDGVDGADLLDGGTGVDTVYHYEGAARIYVDNAADVVADSFVGDGDRVFASVSYALSAASQIEILSTTNTSGIGAINLTGNEIGQQLVGNAGANIIDGKGAADTMTGFGGGDTYFVDVAGDRVIEAAGGGFDRVFTLDNYSLTAGSEIELLAMVDADAEIETALFGNAFAQTIRGNNGTNFIDGLGGGDTMQGFQGDDEYFVDNAADKVLEIAGGGIDRVTTYVSYTLTAGAEIERFITIDEGATTAINLTGNAFAQDIRGNAGANVLNGLGGADTMSGLGGNDTYYVDNAGDVVTDFPGSGTADRVLTSVSYTLGVVAQIELFTTTNVAGTGAINLTGSGTAQTIVGNAGVNLIDGQGGADTMQGMGGSDTYMVDNAGDRIVEAAGGGSDTVKASVSFVLTVGADVEVLRTTIDAGVDAINLTGNALGQTIIGNAGVNVLNGMGGADTMQGVAGNDQYYVDNAADAVVEGAGQGTADRVLASVSYTLGASAQVELLTTTNAAGTGAINLTGNGFAQTIGGNAGANIINGGAGTDTLSGFGGNDTFFFNTALGASNVDRITDYNVAQDTIRLENAIFAGLAVGALAPGAFNTGAAATQADDRIIYNAATGALIFDADGLGGNAGIQFATLNAGLGLTAADFFVV